MQTFYARDMQVIHRCSLELQTAHIYSAVVTKALLRTRVLLKGHCMTVSPASQKCIQQETKDPDDSGCEGMQTTVGMSIFSQEPIIIT